MCKKQRNLVLLGKAAPGKNRTEADSGNYIKLLQKNKSFCSDCGADDRRHRRWANQSAWAMAQALAPRIRDALLAGIAEHKLQAAIIDSIKTEQGCD